MERFDNRAIADIAVSAILFSMAFALACIGIELMPWSWPIGAFFVSCAIGSWIIGYCTVRGEHRRHNTKR